MGKDSDELIDLYDAREGGGFVEEGQLAPCREEACQPLPPAAPEPPLASATLTGSGNAKPLKCKKGQVKRKGKCVKKHKRKQKHRRAKQRKHPRHNRGGHR